MAPPGFRARLTGAWLPATAALGAFAVYGATLAPGVPAGDSGELITVAATGGVAHPPGYPLWTLLARAALALLPEAEPAWTLNLLSATCAALAVGVLAAATRRLAGSAWAGAVAAAAVACAPPLWKMAIVAEVFALNALLAACVLDAFSRVLARAGTEAARADGRSARPWPVVALALLAGLLVAHHHTLALLAAPVVLVTAALVLAPEPLLGRAWPHARRPYPPTAALALASALALAVGLAPIAYVPVAAAAHPPLSWGDVGDLRDLLRLLLRVDFGTFRLDPVGGPHAGAADHAALYLASLPRDLGVVAVVLLVPGVVALARRPALAAALAGFAALQWAFFGRVGFASEPPLLRGVVERFHALPDLVLAVVAGLGAARLLERLAGRTRAAAGAALLVALVAVPLAAHGPRISQRGRHTVERHASDVLAAAPAGAVLFVRGDLVHNALAHAQHVRGERLDVTVVDQELLGHDWYVRALRRRAPDLLPPLAGGERFVLRGGRVVEGVRLDARGDTLTVLGVERPHRIARADLVRIERPPPDSLYRDARRPFRVSWLLPPADDRYSGLPPSLNVRWIDHLAGRRPVAFVGFKDDSWTLRYTMREAGHLAIAYPREASPSPEAAAALDLDALARMHLDEVFVAHDPWSFEAAERARLAAVIERATLRLTRRATFETVERHPALERLLAVAARAEVEPEPEPALLRSAGVLRLIVPRFRDVARARTSFERFIARAPEGRAREETRRWLDALARE